MPEFHPYVGVTGVLVQILDQLRKSFPSTLDAETLKKLGFAPGNESRILNIIRFINLIDENGTRTETARKLFTLHDSGQFEQAFSENLKAAYADLFKLHGDDAWSLEKTKLITFFRQTDHSAEVVGTRQANTFSVLAAYAGHRDSVSPAKPKMKSASNGKSKSTNSKPSPKPAVVIKDPPAVTKSAPSDRNLGLTARIEINLPSSGDQDTYDKIFKSIRENLING